MPEKLDRCVNDVKDQGKSDDSAWAICVDSTGEKPQQESLKDKVNKSMKANIAESIILKEHVGDNTFKVKGKTDGPKKPNANRQVPIFNAPIKKGKVEPDNQKTTKGIGGPRLNQDSFLWKDIFDAQLKKNGKNPKI